jgi:Tol biopolymer transport system component
MFLRSEHDRASWFVLALAVITGVFVSVSVSAADPPSFTALLDPLKQSPQWTVHELKKSDIQGIRTYSPDGKRFLVNKEDKKGVAQIYIGKTGSNALTCITDSQVAGGPKPSRLKMQPHWSASGKWIFVAVERDEYTPPPIIGKNRDFVEGQLQCGIWTNMYAVSPDGKRWHRLTDFKSGVPGTADGYTGPALTPDGKKAVWSQVVDGNILAYWPFGKWELILADCDESTGVPRFSNLKNITPKGMHWNEPGNFSPDNESLLISGSTEKDAQGMDQYVLNIKTGKLTNLTNSPTVWDEHGVFSPDGEKIIFMSAHPYRAEPNSSKVLGIKSEFMLMNKDGSGLTQLTHFREPGHPDFVRNPKKGIAACAEWMPDGRTVNLSTLIFPKYEFWDMTFNIPGKAKP